LILAYAHAAATNATWLWPQVSPVERNSSYVDVIQVSFEKLEAGNSSFLRVCKAILRCCEL